MGTVLANPVEMIRQGAPHLIHSDEELELYTEQLFSLTSQVNLSSEDEEAIELLTLLIEKYESEKYPIPQVDPVEVVLFLLENRGLAQKDLAEDFGSESNVSLVLRGKRQLRTEHIRRLSSRFNVSPAVFFEKTR
jgi:HTH-type transcriptional regulator/antitoxin HigA